jgi:hypothetical protein
MGLIDFQVNWLAVIVATVANMALGFAWYGPLFGERWMRLSGQRRDEVRMEPTAYVPTIIGAFIVSWVLALLAKHVGATTIVDGAVLGVLAWLGFVATATFADVVFGGRPIALWTLNNGYQLVILAVAGAIVAAWR